MTLVSLFMCGTFIAAVARGKVQSASLLKPERSEEWWRLRLLLTNLLSVAKRESVLCAGVAGGGGDDRSGLRDKCHQFLPQFVSRPSPASPPPPAAALPRAGIFSHHVGPNVGAGPLSVSIVPQRRVSIGGLVSGPQFCSLMAAA